MERFLYNMIIIHAVIMIMNLCSVIVVRDVVMAMIRDVFVAGVCIKIVFAGRHISGPLDNIIEAPRYYQ